MPIIHASFSECQIQNDLKEEFIQKIVELMANTLNVPPCNIRVYLNEYQNKTNRIENSVFYDIKVVGDKTQEQKRKAVMELLELTEKYGGIDTEGSSISFTILQAEDCYIGKKSIYEIRNKK